MKILFISYDAVSLGAFSIRVRALICSLARRGHEITLVTAVKVAETDEINKYCVRLFSIPSRFREGPARIYHRIVSLPDPAGPWAREIIEDPRILGLKADTDLIFISSPPHGIQEAGMVLHSKWGTPYIADLRDDWVGNHRTRFLTPLHKHRARELELRMVQEATLILANTRQMREQFIARHPAAGEKVVVLTNGFNESEFNGLASDGCRSVRARVGYVGSGYGGFVSRVLSGMARQWISQNQQAQWQISAYMGSGTPFSGIPSELLGQFPFLTPIESAAKMNECDVLLLLMPPGERVPSPTVPLKTYSYLRTGLPIVYCGEQGATTELLEKFEGTFCLPRCAGAELAEFFIANRNMWTRRYPRKDIARYSFESLGIDLEQHLCGVLNCHRK
ncbi:glycosyltransferase [Geothrix fuzhouensis]|uniref:glycosyltransferase n=1 Tax=Geothrix fuzhouensis TaxID=2966451 RepID=UPI00352F12F7